MKSLNHLTHLLSERILFPAHQRWFNALLYAWFLINPLLFWSEKGLIWGMDSVLLRYGATDNIIENFAYSLMYDLRWYPYVFIPHLISAGLSMFDYRWVFVPRFITWITGILLFYAGIPAFNSGFLIALLLAFYSIAASTQVQAPWRKMLTNVAFYACVFQLVLCYLFSAIFKWQGEMWLDGTAVYYSLQLDRFSSDWLRNSVIATEMWVSALLTYVALLYQTFFPILVFWRKTKPYTLLLGVSMHLFIGFAMHLWDFALIMLISYILFIPRVLRPDNA